MFDVTPLIRAYARYRMGVLRTQDPVETQRRQLLRLIARARGTRFAGDHDFAGIADVGDYQVRVPLRRFEDFWEAYWAPTFPLIENSTWPGTIPFFAQTSGTTSGITKNIPCTVDMIRSNKQAGLDILVHHVANRPRSRLLAGRTFMLGGSTALQTLAPGVEVGDLSGIAGKTMPWWARLRTFPPRALETIADWEEKIVKLASASLMNDIRGISGTPSWLLLFFEKLSELTASQDRRLVNFYPELELLIHGGVNYAPYRAQFTELLEGSHAETREVYPASEGFIAIADRGEGEGLRLLIDHGLFMEFVPVKELDSSTPTRYWLADVEPGVDYAIVLTTCAGLWSYVMGDTVRFVDLDPPRILVTGRTSYSLSAFGEHLIDAEIEEAVSAAADAIGAQVTDYAVGALFPEAGSVLGGHLYMVEFAGAVPGEAEIRTFVDVLDRDLCANNDDYRVHRAEGFGLKPPQVRAVPHGSFAGWMKQRGQLGGQHKVPRVINDTELFDDLRAYLGLR